ncbi:unnamed protein product, partial [Heligmosomoides polygyrus]|uniref:HTH_Tnp_Tc3_2 domain-containing protein n=1 Tax=Heligmosomoides polygyrus TaxID=6339 RepID=A0A183FR66_HELPZ
STAFWSQRCFYRQFSHCSSKNGEIDCYHSGNDKEGSRADRRRSMREMAQELNISASSVRTIVRRKLNMCPYRIQGVGMLTERMKAQRLHRWRNLLKRFASGTHRTIVFSDEKASILQPTVNRQNGGILSQNVGAAIRDGKLVSKTTSVQRVMRSLLV